MAETTAPDFAPLAARTRINALVLPVAVVTSCTVLVLAFGTPLPVPLLLGAAGWILALVLRQPVALAASRFAGRERAATIVGWCSGPAEELVRLGLVLLALHSFEAALWAGFGWAAVEVLLVAVNTLVIADLVTKDDPKSRQARQLLADQGMTTPQHPLWGLLERFSATALHLGFTLLLFAQPWLVLLTLPAHSLTNMLAVRFAKTHLGRTEAALAAAGALALAAGLALALALALPAQR
ncbi:hypothetical protein [Arthrobacter mobilis]|uniref:Uncharacterized protein n=1 Tax=Arthrobacter mobilis TaxID=2724944 RepID=A0A7X6H9L3_9MICC|nr:hypothetical protein [Arthrobacter mobilis]NKX52981.1 hypothetical protein [Arthrobacter mobilis]